MSKDAHKDQAVKVLYAELNKYGQNGEFEKAIKTANRSKIFHVVAKFIT